MRVRDLVAALKALPNQHAMVVIGEGAVPDLWLIVSGLVQRGIRELDEDHAVVGTDPAIEIV